MANDIRTAHLGVPKEIKVKNCPNLGEMDCESTELLEYVALHGNVGDKGAIQRVVSLLAQRMREDATTEFSVTTDLTEDEVMNGTSRAFHIICKDNEGNVISPLVLSYDVEVIEGATPVLVNDTLIVSGFSLFTIKVTKVGNGAAASGKCMVNVMEWNPSLVTVIAENPSLVAVIAEWPDVVNSLVDTGKMNYIVSERGGCINTNVKANHDTRIIFEGKIYEQSGLLSAVFGADDSSSTLAYDCWLRYLGDNVNSDSISFGNTAIYSSSNIGTTPLNQHFKIDANKTHWTNTLTDGTKVWDKTFPAANFTTTEPLHILNYKRKNTALSTNRCKYGCSYCEVNYAGGKMIFIPFVRGGIAGMLNIAEGADFNHFYANANSSGTFTITTEPK